MTVAEVDGQGASAIVAPMRSPAFLIRATTVALLPVLVTLSGCRAVQVVAAPVSLLGTVAMESGKVAASGARATGRVARRAVGGSGRVTAASVGAGTTATATTIGTGVSAGSVVVGTTTTVGGVAVGTTATVGGVTAGVGTMAGGVAAGQVAGAAVGAAGRVSAATLYNSGRVAVGGVRVAGTTAATTVDALAGLAQAGLITFVDGGTGSVVRIPWRRGLNLYGGTAIARVPLASRAVVILRAGRIIYRMAHANAVAGAFQLSPGDVIRLADTLG